MANWCHFSSVNKALAWGENRHFHLVTVQIWALDMWSWLTIQRRILFTELRSSPEDVMVGLSSGEKILTILFRSSPAWHKCRYRYMYQWRKDISSNATSTGTMFLLSPIYPLLLIYLWERGQWIPYNCVWTLAPSSNSEMPLLEQGSSIGSLPWPALNTKISNPLKINSPPHLD